MDIIGQTKLVLPLSERALTEVTADTADGELQASLGAAAGGLLGATASLSFS